MARWLYGPAAELLPSLTADPDLRRARERRLQAVDDLLAYLARYDWARRDAAYPPIPTGASPRTEERLRRSYQGTWAVTRRHGGRLLGKVLRAGLERRIGDGVDQPAVYVSLIARGARLPDLAACESCLVVFERQRGATRCSACRRNPPRYKLYALVDGGWHRSARLGPAWHHFADGKPGEPRGVYYEGVCTACGGAFSSTDARQHLCRNCGQAAGRVRRVRGGSLRGRQRFSFTGIDGPITAVGGVVLADWRRESLYAIDGVITTDDAEIARQLADNPQMRAISETAAK